MGREFSGWKNRKELAWVRFGQRKWSSIVEEEASTRGKVRELIGVRPWGSRKACHMAYALV